MLRTRELPFVDEQSANMCTGNPNNPSPTRTHGYTCGPGSRIVSRFRRAISSTVLGSSRRRSPYRRVSANERRSACVYAGIVVNSRPRPVTPTSRCATSNVDDTRPFVLLLRARGLSVADVGVTLAIFAASTAVFELPTGGLADVVGRRPVLIAAAVLFVAQNVMFGLGDCIGVLIVAAAVGGLGRALDCGPLEAWFVDRAEEAGAGVDLTRELSRTWAIEAGAAGVGVLAAGALVAVVPMNGDGVVIALSVPFLVSAVVGLATLVTIMVWVTEPARQTGATLRNAATDVPRAIRLGVRLSASPGPSGCCHLSVL
ncbi:hypothetical protein BH24ACT5_BH24ACT5_15630 [soil metagenome]